MQWFHLLSEFFDSFFCVEAQVSPLSFVCAVVRGMLCEVFHLAILSFLDFVTCGLPNMSLVGISIFRFQLIDYKLCVFLVLIWGFLWIAIGGAFMALVWWN